MESPNRSVIVNENDNRKLEIYEQGDLDASPSGIGMFACDPTTTMRILKTDNLGNLNVNVQSGTTLSSIAGMSIPAHDYIGMTYTGDNLTTVVYKAGGAGGTTVATLTLAYTGSVLDSVTKS